MVRPRRDRSFPAQAKLYPSAAEAEAAGDHQALALALAHRAVADAGGAAALALGGDAAAKDRVGVYFGAWQRGGGEGKASAYGALGEALGALPGRVAESLDARGPCLLVDTACSWKTYEICIIAKLLSAQAISKGVQLSIPTKMY